MGILDEHPIIDHNLGRMCQTTGGASIEEVINKFNLSIMTEYRRPYIPGATWFFTVNLAERKGNRLLVDKIDILREVFAETQKKHPFRMDAVVVLPDHLHCIWTLPENDADFSTRWNMLKGAFSKRIEKGEPISVSRQYRRERGIWQRRFWEHCIRDQLDYNKHVDYIHWNPVKHQWVKHVQDWPHSSYHRYVKEGIYPINWGDIIPPEIDGIELE